MTRPARIPKAMPQHRRRPDPRRAVSHLDFIREIGICIACGAEGRCQAMHIRSSGDGATGLKPGDKYTLPGCAMCHHEQHRVGEVAFFGALGIDPVDFSSRLWTVSGDLDAGRRIIFRARQAIELRGKG